MREGRSLGSRRVTTVALGLAILVVLGALVVFTREHFRCLYDDAYIYFRYVRNLRSGCGPRFNCDDPPVEGFSSPLYLLLLLAGRTLSRDLEAVAQIIGSLSLGVALCGALVCASQDRLSGGGQWVTAAITGSLALLFLDHFLLLNAVMGLEAPLMAAFVVATFWALLTERFVAASLCAVMCLLTRPEGLLLVLFLPLFPQMRRARLALPVVAAVSIFWLGRWLLFRDVLPNTYWAKAGGTLRHAQLGLDYVRGTFDEFPVTVLAPFALMERRARRVIAYFLLVTAVWYGFFLSSGGDTFAYSRLAVPLVPVLTLLGLVGIVGVVRAVARSSRFVAGEQAAAGAAALLSVIVALRAYRVHRIAPMHGFANVTSWKVVGRYLQQRHPGARVATVPIGAIGYYFHGHVLDLVGLTAAPIAKSGTSTYPKPLERHWIGHERHFTPWVLEQKPDLIVTTEVRAEPWTDLQEARAGFIADWELVRLAKRGAIPYVMLDAEIAPGAHWLMFQRRAEASPTPVP